MKKLERLKLTDLQCQTLLPGVFHVLGQSKGRTQYLILMRMPLVMDKLRVDFGVELNEDPEFQHYFVYDIDNEVIGSYLSVRTKFSKHTPITVSRVLNSVEPCSLVSTLANASGGIFLFSDGQGTCMALAESSGDPDNPLVVKGKEK